MTVYHGRASQAPAGLTAVALYARVAQQNHARIEQQLTTLRQFAAAQGWHIAAAYTDNGESGNSLARPGLDRLREDARLGHFSRVLVTDPDRLSRSFADYATLVAQWQALGITAVWTEVG